MADEDLILDRDALTDEGVTRDLASPSDARILLNLDEGTNFCLVSNLAAVQVDELPERDVFSERDIGGNAYEVVRGIQCAPFPESTARGVARRIFRSVHTE